MRLSINHLNLGLFYEVCLVCNTEDYAYYQGVVSSMNALGVKTKLYNYERSIGKINRLILATTHSVIFILNGNNLEKAVADKENPLRQVLEFLNKHNPNAISLATTDDVSEAAKIIFPKELSALNWLHRKRFVKLSFGKHDLAVEFCNEVRSNIGKRTLDKMEKLNLNGVENSRRMYKVLFFVALISFCAPFLLFGGYMLTTLSGNFILKLISLLGYLIWFVSIVASCFCTPYILVCFLGMRDKMLDVSLTFADFRKRTRFRLSIIMMIYAFIILFQIVFSIGNISSFNLPSELLNPLFPLIYFAIIALSVLINCAVLWRIAATEDYYLSFSLKRFKYLPIALLLTAFAVIGLFYLYNAFNL